MEEFEEFDTTITDIGGSDRERTERLAAVFLLIDDGSNTQIRTVDEGDRVVIGRTAPSDIIIPEPSLSRQHARFELTDGEIWVEDLQSTNGTVVNRRTVMRTRVRPGDVVELGTIMIDIHLRQPPSKQERVRPKSGEYEQYLSLLELKVIQTFLSDAEPEADSDLETDDYTSRFQRCERKLLKESLSESNWDEEVAARTLRIPLADLQDKISRYQLKKQ